MHCTAVIARHDLAFGLPRLLEGEVGRGEKVGIDLWIQQRRSVEQCLGQLDWRQGLAPDELGRICNR
jgi:hypothetical protein